MEKKELANRQLGLREMFLYYAKCKIKDSPWFYLKKDNTFNKHKLFQNQLHAKEICKISEEIKFYKQWYNRLLNQKEIEPLDYLDNQDFISLLDKIQTKEDFIKELHKTKFKLLYIDYEQYTTIIKAFNIKMQDYLCEGYPVLFKEIGLFILTKVGQPRKSIDWKATKERKKEYVEKGITDSAYVYHVGCTYSLKFIKRSNNTNMPNMNYYLFKISGGRTTEGSKSFKYKIFKRIKQLKDVVYWQKDNALSHVTQNRTAIFNKAVLDSVDTSNLLI